jgi:hypothetical protein
MHAHLPSIILVLFALLADRRIKSILYYDQKRRIIIFRGLAIGILLFFLTKNLSQLPIAERMPIPPRSSTFVPAMVKDVCKGEYERVTSSRMIGFMTDDLERSRAYLGNRKRLATFTEELQNREQLNVVVNGGSVTLGNGVDPKTLRYSDQLEVWLNEMYPVDGDHCHRVFKMGSHGADVCVSV